jgi:hypothetical protein
MAEVDVDRITAAATAVIKALEPLSPEERARVIQSAAALYGIRAGTQTGRSARSSSDFGGQDDESEVDAGDDQGTDLGRRLSIVELLKQKQPATNSQRITVFAFYREHVEKKARFARGDLEPYFSSAKLAKPANYDRDFAGAVREGWVHEDGGESYLTQAGEDAVKEGFAGKGKPRGVSVARKKKTKPTGK